jgi:hypothetical protein
MTREDFMQAFNDTHGTTENVEFNNVMKKHLRGIPAKALKEKAAEIESQLEAML